LYDKNFKFKLKKEETLYDWFKIVYVKVPKIIRLEANSESYNEKEISGYLSETGYKLSRRNKKKDDI